MPRIGRPPAITAEQYPMLVKLAQAHPFSSQAELADAFH
ncbi:helix-turn-helix domain-containing protein, partial [Pseudomonas sp. LAMO17WK12:I10]